MPDPTRVILDPAGRPARTAVDESCPRCGASPDARVASAGFGAPHPVCRQCGYEWYDAPWVEPQGTH